jgi:hypothetical protein
MEEIELLDIADDLLVINKTTIERLFQLKDHNALVLYLFYYKTAKWQKHNPIKATDEYCKRCLHWGIDKVQNTKKALKELQLIETIRRTDDKGIVIGWYIKVNYLVDEPRIPISTIPTSPQLVGQEINTINNNILNTINNTSKKEYKERYFDKEELNEIFIEFLQLRKKLKAVNSDRAINSLLKKLNNYDDDTKYKMIEQSIVSSWKNVYEVKENKRKEMEYDTI